MIEAVLSYHMNPYTCGVAKFNRRLARELGVPCLHLRTHLATRKHVLVSIKPSEIESDDKDFDWLVKSYDLLLHERPGWPPDHRKYQRATQIYYADELGCPSTVEGDPTRGDYRVLVFGMAHKLLLPHFQDLKVQLDNENPGYTIELSTAVHEGSPWDETIEESIYAMTRIFGDRLRVLGFLGDDALAKELQDVDAVAAFYHPALRANNTSAWAAVAAGKKLYTNRDEHSPDITNPPTWKQLVETFRA